jgi:alkylation response protein AidB-like acyl-CoA dehydrogenase
MDLRLTPEEAAFRAEVRAFIADNLPREIRERMRLGYAATKPEIVTWQRILNRKGWAAYSWPKPWGGPGWNAIQRMIFLEENLMAPAPELSPFNINMIGPVLLQFGTDAQRSRFLPRAANLDDWWCQGFSEPGAGSDLASLRTAAKLQGDSYIVNGQKIWTSTAHNADWCFCLVRTKPAAAKRQEGISFLLIDMRTPGIEVRPIISIDGNHHLNEVFFTDVKVPAENLVGEENKGWNVAKFLLGNERTGIAQLGKSKERVEFARSLAREVRMNGHALIEDQNFRTRVAQLEVELKALEITQMRVVSDQEKSQDSGKPDPLSSVLKIRGTELQQGSTELAMDAGGAPTMAVWQRDLAAAVNEPPIGPDWAPALATEYLFLRAASIYGGTNEIQKNILNKAVLGL